MDEFVSKLNVKVHFYIMMPTFLFFFHHPLKCKLEQELEQSRKKLSESEGSREALLHQVTALVC